MKIAIDIDGVVVDLVESWLRKFHPDHVKEDMYSWSGFDGVGSTVEEFFEEICELTVNDIIMIKDASETIKRIREKHDVFFLTDKHSGVMGWTVGVLKKYGLGNIEFINCKVEDKQKEEYNYDVLIDDCPLRIDDGRLYMFDQPWNRSIYFNNRVFGWLDFESKI